MSMVGNAWVYGENPIGVGNRMRMGNMDRICKSAIFRWGLERYSEDPRDV
jgi:hypothetical protein